MVFIQLVMGVNRPKPFPNNLLRRTWLWAHRVIGDTSLVLAWVQIWQGILVISDRNVLLALSIAMGLFMAGSAVVTPMYFMLISSIKATEQDEEEGPSRSILSHVLPEEAEQQRDAMFHGCGHCSQVF